MFTELLLRPVCMFVKQTSSGRERKLKDTVCSAALSQGSAAKLKVLSTNIMLSDSPFIKRPGFPSSQEDQQLMCIIKEKGKKGTTFST